VLPYCPQRADRVPVALSLGGGMKGCRQQHLKVMVWTVNNEREIRYWLSRQRTSILVTDRPALAVAIRGQTATEHASGITRRGSEDAS